MSKITAKRFTWILSLVSVIAILIFAYQHHSKLEQEEMIARQVQIQNLEQLNFGDTFIYHEKVSTLNENDMNHVANILKAIANNDNIELTEVKISKDIIKFYKIAVHIKAKLKN